MKTIINDIDSNGGRLIEWSDGSSILYHGKIDRDYQPILVTQAVISNLDGQMISYTEKRNYSIDQLTETIKTGKIRWFHQKDEPVIKPEYKQKTLFD